MLKCWPPEARAVPLPTSPAATTTETTAGMSPPFAKIYVISWHNTVSTRMKHISGGVSAEVPGAWYQVCGRVTQNAIGRLQISLDFWNKGYDRGQHIASCQNLHIGEENRKRCKCSTFLLATQRSSRPHLSACTLAIDVYLVTEPPRPNHSKRHGQQFRVRSRRSEENLKINI